MSTCYQCILFGETADQIVHLFIYLAIFLVLSCKDSLHSLNTSFGQISVLKIFPSNLWPVCPCSFCISVH
jgi:hypothetical protein